MQTTTLVLDARTLRIIHFTELEPSALPKIEGNLITTVATESLPPDLKLKTSYNFRFEQGSIVQDKPQPKAKPQTVIEANQAALNRQLDARLRADWCRRSPWASAYDIEDRCHRFQQVEISLKTRICAASEQETIDVLAKEIAIIDIK